jgi:hypothetical protein
MGEEILVSDRIDAGAEFIREFNDAYPVSVACWMIPAETDNFYLYLASDKIDGGNKGDAYGEVIRIFRNRPSEWLDPFHIKLINSSDPLAREAIQIRDRYQVPVATRYWGTYLGGMGINGAYIYPPLSTVKTAP